MNDELLRELGILGGVGAVSLLVMSYPVAEFMLNLQYGAHELMGFDRLNVEQEPVTDYRVRKYVVQARSAIFMGLTAIPIGSRIIYPTNILVLIFLLPSLFALFYWLFSIWDRKARGPYLQK